MSCVSLDLGSHDIYFDVIAEQVVSDCEEAEFLCELARQNESGCVNSLGTVLALVRDASQRRARTPSQWFKENQP